MLISAENILLGAGNILLGAENILLGMKNILLAVAEWVLAADFMLCLFQHNGLVFGGQRSKVGVIM